MKKFLLTLLFIVFANPLFAEDIPTKTKPTKKLNIQINISNQTTKSLETITKNFNKFMENNICAKSNEQSSIQLNEYKNQLTICKDANTIKDIYNCVCKSGGEFYEKLKYITDFKKLSGTTAEQFTQLQSYYNALDSIKGIQQLTQVVKDVKKQNEDEETARQARRTEIINKFKREITAELIKERNLRNENPEIVKELTSPQCKNDCLEKHNSTNDANIEKWVANNGNDNDLDKILDKYIDKVINDNHLDSNEALETFLNDTTNPKNEKGITDRNIERIRKAKEEKDAQDARDRENALEELAKRKKEEAELINKILAFKESSNPKVNENITKENCNTKETNNDLNPPLRDILGETTAKPHPNEPTDEVDKIRQDVEDTKTNIENLNRKWDELNDEKNAKIEELFNKIKAALHLFNLSECELYGRIDTIATKQNQGRLPAGISYNRIGVTGKTISRGNQEACDGLQESTIDDIKQLTDGSKKNKWIECLTQKETTIYSNTNSVDTYIKEFKKGQNLQNCSTACYWKDNFKKSNDEENYDLWYTGNRTKYDYIQDNSGHALEDQINICKINSFICKDENGQTIHIDKAGKSYSELEAECLRIQEEQEDLKNSAEAEAFLRNMDNWKKLCEAYKTIVQVIERDQGGTGFPGGINGNIVIEYKERTYRYKNSGSYEERLRDGRKKTIHVDNINDIVTEYAKHMKSVCRANPSLTLDDFIHIQNSERCFGALPGKALKGLFTGYLTKGVNKSATATTCNDAIKIMSER